MTKALLAPAAALVIWSLVVLVWMAVTRFSGLRSAPKERLREMPRAGARAADVEKAMPGKANWAAHNYTHLMEQPTLFYATALTVALIVHSLWQGTVNTIPVRFGLFLASSACLFALAINALRAALA